MFKSGTCPSCGNNYNEYKEPEFVGNSRCYYPVKCHECGSTWEEVFELTYMGNVNVYQKDKVGVCYAST